MALSEWWIGESQQRYWLEITDRLEVGDDLQAPHSGHNAHELVSAVRPGDRVLHWVKSRGLVGWSEVVAAPQLKPGWNDGGWYDTNGVWHDGPWWIISLSGLQGYDDVVTLEKLKIRRDPVLRCIASVTAKRRVTTYEPFNRHGQGIRPRQGYFAKWPVELFEQFPEARSAESAEVPPLEVDEDESRPGNKLPRGVTSRAQDSVLRKALERHAVSMAMKRYDRLDADEIVELGKPYDLRVTIGGVERHVEVKGSSQQIATVELTRNEVRHAETSILSSSTTSTGAGRLTVEW